jgi:hypothetical protein
MTAKEKIEFEKNNHDKIILFKEGLFWIAYELSAFRFVTRVKPFKAKRKKIQPLGIEAASMGVPVAHLYNIIKERQLEIDDRTESMMFIRAPKPVDDHGFSAWKAALEFFDPTAIYLRKLHAQAG